VRVKFFRFFIASIFLLQGTLCPSLCRAGVYDGIGTAESAAVQPCHDMSASASSENSEPALIAGNSRLSPEDLENLKRLQENQKNQVQKNSPQNKPAQDKPVEEKKTKSPCCGDGELLITHSSARADDLGFHAVELPVQVSTVTLLSIFSTYSTVPVLAQGQYRASPDLRILYSSFLI
jgi:hypothetical protein